MGGGRGKGGQYNGTINTDFIQPHFKGTLTIFD